MRDGDIIREAIKTCGWSQEEFAKRLGYARQSSLSSRMSRGKMSVENFVRMLDALGYKVVIESKSPNTNKNKWILDLGGEASEGE